MQDWQIVNLVEYALAVLAIGVVAYSPVARALGNRIMHGKVTPGAPAADDQRVELLSGEVAALREQLDAALDRLDFTERLLAKARERGLLEAPK